MVDINLAAAWAGILAGMAGGAILGLSFHREEWLGGYGSWRRRLLRLGHISLFGLAFVNLAYSWTAHRLGWTGGPAAGLFVAGAVLMPAVCGLAAWRKPFRHLFALPVGCLVGGAALTAAAVLSRGGAS